MAHTIRCGRAKHDRCKCICGGAHHGEEATELDRSDPEPLPPVEIQERILFPHQLAMAFT